MAGVGTISADATDFQSSSTSDSSSSSNDTTNGILRMTGGNVTQAARLAKRNRTEFYKLLDRHSIEPKIFKTGGASRTAAPAESSSGH